MKKSYLFTVVVLAFCLVSPAWAGDDTHSGKAASHGSQASQHASGSAAHAIMASGQVVSGAASVPFMASGASGAVSAQIGEDLNKAATAPADGPLEISDETITVGPPPDQAMKETKPAN